MTAELQQKFEEDKRIAKITVACKFQPFRWPSSCVFIAVFVTEMQQIISF
jgi:hypothetical protein